MTGLIGKMSMREAICALSLWSDKKEPPLVSWCLSSRCSVNGHEPHVSEIIKVKWRRVAEKNVWRTTPKTGSTSQNYYSIHAQPDLNSLDFSIYLLSIGPSCTKNTMACLTFGTFCHCLCTHSVIVCAQQAFTLFCRWLHAKETNGFACFVKLWIYSDSLLEPTIFLFLIYLVCSVIQGCYSWSIIVATVCMWSSSLPLKEK